MSRIQRIQSFQMFLVVCHLWVSPGAVGSEPNVETEPRNARIHRVELSYDDGPDTTGRTRGILIALNTLGARATFYLVGRRVVEGDNWRLVFDLAATGHWLGNHAYDWNTIGDDHVWLFGPAERRARKILHTEWAIRDALIKGRDDARQRNAWTSIPEVNRTYIENVIMYGTGRFRTPGFRSHWVKLEKGDLGPRLSWDGTTTRVAIDLANKVLAASGLRTLAITEVTKWAITHEGVILDPEDWRLNLKQADVEARVISKLDGEPGSILLHSRIAASAAATPAIVADIKRRGWIFTPTVQGEIGSIIPMSGFAGVTTISNPPTPTEIATARAFLRKNASSLGGLLAGNVAIGIFQMAQRAGPTEVDAFIAELKSTTIQTAYGPVPIAGWMHANADWGLFASFYNNWRTNAPFPRIQGVTL